MPPFEAGPLPKKLPDLHKEPEVERAVVKHKRQSEERLPNTPEAKIDTYLNRLEAVFVHPDEKRRQRNLELFKPVLHEAFVIAPEDVPESYFELQKRIVRERGEEVREISPEQREKMTEVIVEDQEKSLDEWVDYLGSEDAGYPTWFKYFALRNIVKMSQFDKDRGTFKKRSKDTTAPFPEIYHEALGIVADKLEDLANGDTEKFRNDEEFQRYAERRFADLYGEEVQESIHAALEGREIIQGEWKTFPKGDMEAAEKLYASLRGKGTGWCTAGKSTARGQVNNGDFHVYYTYRNQGDNFPTMPRLAIRMQGDEIGEVRGVLPKQEAEPVLQEVLDSKLNEFGDKADVFKKKSADMKQVTVLTEKKMAGEELSAEELLFLYEIESRIEGFGYGRDPRIAELREGRDRRTDLKKILTDISENEDEMYEMAIKKPGVFFDALLALKSNRKEVEEKLISHGGGALVIDREDLFPAVDRPALMDRVIAEGNGKSLIDLYNRPVVYDIPGIDVNELIQKLAEAGEGEAIARSPLFKSEGYYYGQHFSDKTAEALINAGQPQAIVDRIGAFEDNLSEKTRKRLLEVLDVESALKIKERILVSEDAEKAFAERCIQEGKAHLLVRAIDEFSEGIHPDILEKILTSRNVESLVGNLQEFKGVDYDEVVKQIAKQGDMEVFISRSHWKDVQIDYDFVANTLLETERIDSGKKDLRTLSANFDFFQDLSEEVLLKVLDEVSVAGNERILLNMARRLRRKQGYADSEYSYTRHYLDGARMADTILGSENLMRKVMPYLKKVKDLPEDVANTLLDMSEGYFVADNLSCFENLSEETILRLQPYAHDYSLRSAA